MKYKEFLNMKNGYKLEILPEYAGDDKESGLIEVPDGAESYYKGVTNDSADHFIKIFDGACFYNYGKKWSVWLDYSGHKNFKVAWQRHTQPEELPFVNDEPSLNDQYAEIEQVRKEYDMSVDDYINSLRCEDTVNHPSHYASSSIECIDAIEAMLTPEQFIGYLRGNVAKYLWRYENKGGITDLEKSQWYLNKLIYRIG